MQQSRDEHYRVLGLTIGSSPSEIKRAYRDLVRVWHPDRFENDSRLREQANEMLKLVNLAYEAVMSELHQAEAANIDSNKNFGTKPGSDEANAPQGSPTGMGQFDSSKVIAVPAGEDSSTGFPLWRTNPFFRDETSRYCTRRLATIREFPSISRLHVVEKVPPIGD